MHDITNPRPYTAYVIVSKERGVYLGKYWNESFWSMLENQVSQQYAPTFPTAKAAMEVAREYQSSSDQIYYVKVQCAEECYASAQELVMAGIVEAAQPLLANQR